MPVNCLWTHVTWIVWVYAGYYLSKLAVFDRHSFVEHWLFSLQNSLPVTYRSLITIASLIQSCAERVKIVKHATFQVWSTAISRGALQYRVEHMFVFDWRYCSTIGDNPIWSTQRRASVRQYVRPGLH